MEAIKFNNAIDALNSSDLVIIVSVFNTLVELNNEEYLSDQHLKIKLLELKLDAIARKTKGAEKLIKQIDEKIESLFSHRK